MIFPLCLQTSCTGEADSYFGKRYTRRESLRNYWTWRGLNSSFPSKGTDRPLFWELTCHCCRCRRPLFSPLDANSCYLWPSHLFPDDDRPMKARPSRIYSLVLTLFTRLNPENPLSAHQPHESFLLHTTIANSALLEVKMCLVPVEASDLFLHLSIVVLMFISKHPSTEECIKKMWYIYTMNITWP